jgi:hypothetical protein
MNQKYVTFGGIAVVLIGLIVLIVVYMKKKTPCDCPTCQQRINPNDAPLNYFYSNEERKIPPTFAIRDRETGLYLGLCEDNTSVCLTPSKYLTLSLEDNYVPIFDTIYPILNAGKHRPMKAKDGRYLTLSKDGTKLVIESTKPENDSQERLRLFILEQTKFSSDLITRTYWMNGVFGTFSRTITILNGNVIAINYGELSLDDKTKSHHIWEIVPVS